MIEFGAIIFSRMSSKRLPGKALTDLHGTSLLERVIHNVRKIKCLDGICLATSTDKSDDCLENLANSLDINCFRGSLQNVTKRALDSAKYYGYDNIVRVCGDRPFIDLNIYETMITNHKENKNDLTTNIFPRTVPPGLTCEIISTKSLEKTLSLTNNSEDLEHVTRYIYNSPNEFKIQNINFPFNKEEINLRLVIDDETDLKRTNWILKKSIENNYELDTKKIISLTKKWIKNN